MVIILQQTMDNGRRFVSTVVEEESSFNSNFSLGSSSHNSISERSAIYKQRIDSLFGRHTRLNPFKPTPLLEPFCIRIDNPSRLQQDNSVDSAATGEAEPRATRLTQSHQQQTTTATTTASSSVFFHRASSNNNHHHQGSSSSFSVVGGKFSSSVPLNNKSKISSHPAIAIEETDFSTSDEDENNDYEKIERIHHHTHHVNPAFVPDSLNTRSSSQHFNPVSRFCVGESAAGKLWLPIGDPHPTHVSTVRLNCESGEDEDGSKGLSEKSIMTRTTISPNTPNGEMKSKQHRQQSIGESHMWHNGNYTTESPCTGDERERQYGIVRAMSGGILKFTVDYLGCVPVDGTTTALQDLQAPLRSLYMNYLTGTNVMGGKLAITTDGLRFEAPKLRLVNPFATIAVWAAIKFVARGSAGEAGNSECAFMPLISDPEGQDKSRLFSKMSSELQKAYTNCMNEREENFRNPPIFACVMREASFSLDCHAFACKCAEDAIVIAANLYQSLVDKMRAVSKEGESGYGSLTRNSPSTSQGSPNQIHHHPRSSSSASSQESSPVDLCGGDSSGGSSNSSRCHQGNDIRGRIPGSSKQDDHSSSSNGRHNNHRVVFSDSESIIPVRPPRRKKKSLDSSSSGGGGGSSSGGSGAHLKRYNSDDSVIVKTPHRRRSFKGGNHHAKTKKRVQITTPDETTSSDSVTDCIDHVLDRVIHPGGMSFNDLKPPYQELILKIALTLTQDQLYQKSKQAMKKHQQVNLRKKPSTSSSSTKGSSTPETSDDNSQFLNILMKSFSKITSGNKSSSAQHAKRKVGKMSSSFKNKVISHPQKMILKKLNQQHHHSPEDPFQSFCSGCACDKCSEKCYCSLPSKHNVKLMGLPGAALPCSATPSSGKNPIPAERDFIKGIITNNNGNTGNKNENHHKGNIKGGDEDQQTKKTCGYDTDSCAESEKCYCSLQRVKSNGLKIYNINLDTETSDTDTNSYDFEPFNNKDSDNSKVSDESRTSSKGSRPVEILSYHPAKKITYNLTPSSGNSHVQTTNALVHFEDNHEKPRGSSSSSSSGTAQQSTGGNNNCKLTTRNHSLVSSSYLHSVLHEKQMTGDSKGIHHHQRNKVLLMTGSSNPSSRVMYKDNHYHHHQDGKKSRADNRGSSNLVDITEDEDASSNEEDDPCRHRRLKPLNDNDLAPDKIISMKKTAEIAAMFTDLHLDQTTNVVAEQNDSSGSFQDSSPAPDDSNVSVDFEASLGYLP